MRPDQVVVKEREKLVGMVAAGPDQNDSSVIV